MLSIRETATHLLVAGDDGELDAIDDWFRFQPPGFFYAPSYQRFRVSGGKEGWDGWLHPFSRLRDDHWRLTNVGKICRGHRFELLSMLEEQNLRYHRDKLLPSPFAIDAEDVPANAIEAPFELDLHQREGVAYWLNHAIGISRVTVSGGKTAMFAAAAVMIKDKFPKARILYVTQAERLVRQVTKEMKRFLPELDIGQYGGGVVTGKRAKDLCVCTIAMLHKHFDEHVEDGWFDSFMGLFYDEVHHCASKTSKKVILQIPAYFRFGASDSVKADDVRKNTEIHGLFGPIVVDVKAKLLIDKGRIARPFVYIIDHLGWNNRFSMLKHSPATGSRAFVLNDGEWMAGKYLGPVFETEDDGTIKTKTVKGTTKDDDGEWEVTEQPIIKSGLHRVEVQGTELEVDARWVLLERVYDRCIIQFKERNEAIVEWAKHFSGKGFPTLVCCTRTLHILILETLIGQLVDHKKVRTLYGEDSPSKRDQVFQWFRESDGGILITPLVKEGVSINEIKALIVADYVADWEVANQLIGRAMRKKADDDENTAEVIWFMDRQHSSLRSGCDELFSKLKRIQGYKIGYRQHPKP